MATAQSSFSVASIHLFSSEITLQLTSAASKMLLSRQQISVQWLAKMLFYSGDAGEGCREPEEMKVKKVKFRKFESLKD
jgi:hypothetical protein